MMLWLGGAATLVVAATAPMLETLRWTAPGAEFEALSSQPSACLSFDPNAGPLVQSGQALFNTPALLGGQAAKAGLSCASCHANGRDNPHFQMNGVSKGPGTADVSHSFFGALRGNGQFDPVLIPDLALPGKVSREQGTGALEKFIRALIVEEFAGEEPSVATLESLATYVRAIQPCEKDDKAPVSRRVYDQLSMINATLAVAAERKAQGTSGSDRENELELLIAAARHQLGLISERYAGPKLKRERAALLKASRELQLLSETGSSGEAITDWQYQFNISVAKRLLQKERLSFYDPEQLRTLVAPQRKQR